jgi:uncharacterized protein (DUF433 family)
VAGTRIPVEEVLGLIQEGISFHLVSLDHCLNWPYNCGRI